ncbi:LOW QUALITY PROTEIN: hypothetical protein Cgig2_017527 [Carnegiea gigantea]|uniref:Uncharacterized protein n=1 Tax=Carnegiea gigantea TaxID=171969 RepID=A0A9Q1K3Z7_9CARY|nr:LOW QUALITY PROTEIN: hypothetical protein Cgig2_017527 [Carnegiea gigantea]
MKSAQMAPENQVHTEPLASTHGSPLAPKEPSVAHGSEREPLVGGSNDPIEPYIFGGVEFREKRCKDRWFPTIIHWTTYIVKQRNKDEREFRREHGRVLYLDRVEFIGKRCKDRWFPTGTTNVVKQRNKDEKEFLESMEGVGQLTGNNIIRLFMKEKMNCK